MTVVARTARIFRTVSRALLIAGPAALVFAAVSPGSLQLAAVITGGVLTLLGIDFALIGRYVLEPLDPSVIAGDPERGLAPSGIAATAKILSARVTALRINKRYPVVAIEVAVSMGAQAPFEARVRTVMKPGGADRLEPGTELPVRVDRQNRARVVLDPARALWLRDVLV